MALKNGINMDSFWEHTLGEVILIINCENENKLQALKEKESSIYILASLIANGTASVLSKDVKMPSMYEVFPLLKEETQEENDELNEARRLEAYLMKVAESNNKKYKGKDV